MKSGLEGRNNDGAAEKVSGGHLVSMKSGLEGRNNPGFNVLGCIGMHVVSMKSGLEGRNNSRRPEKAATFTFRLNEVRPRRPEQFDCSGYAVGAFRKGLNEVRPRRPEQFSILRISMSSPGCLNEVRPRRPEQSGRICG